VVTLFKPIKLAQLMTAIDQIPMRGGAA
jgi:hypothetical protein